MSLGLVEKRGFKIVIVTTIKKGSRDETTRSVIEPKSNTLAVSDATVADKAIDNGELTLNRFTSRFPKCAIIMTIAAIKPKYRGVKLNRKLVHDEESAWGHSAPRKELKRRDGKYSADRKFVFGNNIEKLDSSLGTVYPKFWDHMKKTPKIENTTAAETPERTPL